MGNGEKSKILCVEDEPEACKMLQHVLPDFELISAATKAEAVKMANENRFALIFMDYWLPDGTGEEACRQIRAFDSITPILFITASQSFSERKARAMGAQGTVKKASPTFMEDLRDRAVELAIT